MEMHLKVHLTHSQRVATPDVCVTQALRSHTETKGLLCSRLPEAFVIFQENYICDISCFFFMDSVVWDSGSKMCQKYHL